MNLYSINKLTFKKYLSIYEGDLMYMAFETFSIKRYVVRRDAFQFRKNCENLSPPMFQRLYRMSLTKFERLVDAIILHCARHQRHDSSCITAVSFNVMLCVELLLLAVESYFNFCWPYGIAPSTVFKVFQETLSAIENVLEKIRFSQTEEGCRRSSCAFKSGSRNSLHGVIPHVDGLAVKFVNPARPRLQAPVRTSIGRNSLR